MRESILAMVIAAAALVGAPGLGIEATAAVQQQQQQAAPPPAKSDLVNINTADAETLETLPGIGPATAKSIIEYRDAHEGFKKIEELMNVKGVGEKTFLKLKDLITVGPPKLARG